jgi:hypothetical protein
MWDSIVGHWDSTDCKIAVFQSPATPDGIRVPTAKHAKKPTDETPAGPEEVSPALVSVRI